MKNILVWMCAGVLAFVLCGCESMGENTKKGAAGGGLLGAVAGGIIGHQSGHGWEGALIGGASGAAAGGLIGNKIDKKAVAENPDHVTIMKIAEMGQKGVPDSVIIDELEQSGSVYKGLDSETIAYLKDNGVGDRVIDHMLSTAH